MSEITNYKFHSTNQFRNAVKNIQTKAQFKGLDEEGNAIIDKTAIAHTLSYTGTIKLHGTNSSIIIHNRELVTFNSKSQTLAKMEKGVFTLFSDNAEFAQSMQRRSGGVQSLLTQAEHLCYELYGDVKYPIKLSGEWVGQGIQKGVGISFLPKKSFFLFGIKVQDEWLPLKEVSDIYCEGDEGFYNIMDFPTKKIDIDFSNPVFSQNALVEATEEVEECCPVSKQLGVTESLLGEGLVWVPDDPELCKDSGNWFKTKGEKHSVSKTKSVAAVCPEKLNAISEFVEYACTENRIQQGIDEIGLTDKNIGAIIGWVNKDINKEEGDVLESNNLSMKEVGKHCATKTRQYIIQQLNKM